MNKHDIQMTGLVWYCSYSSIIFDFEMEMEMEMEIRRKLYA